MKDKFMKFVYISALAVTPLLAQTSDASRTTGQLAYDEGREHHNYGWIGLLGLVGLAGLRGRSGAHRTQDPLEARGVNVKTVKY